MNTTRMPGFSAEVSIYKSTKSSLMRQAGSFGTLVTPATALFRQERRHYSLWLALCLRHCDQNGVVAEFRIAIVLTHVIPAV